MIVLVILVGVMAVAWPNIQKRLKRATLDQAALALCQAIDDARQQAVRSGKPVIICLNRDDSRMTMGEFAWMNSLTQTRTSDDQALVGVESNLDSTNSNGQPRQIELPEGVVVADVRWEIPTIAGTVESSTGLSDPNATEVAASVVDSDVANSTVTETEGQMLTALSDGDFNGWFLIMDASGQFGDAIVELKDPISQNSVSVQMASATGAVEILP